MTLNILSLLQAGIVSTIIGFVWYHPRVFGTLWMRLSRITPEMVERGKANMPIRGLAAFLASVLAAYVLGSIGNQIGITDTRSAAQFASLVWLGFVAPAMLGIVLWEQKAVTVYLINSLYWLVSLVAMSFVLVL